MCMWLDCSSNDNCSLLDLRWTVTAVGWMPWLRYCAVSSVWSRGRRRASHRPWSSCKGRWVQALRVLPQSLHWCRPVYGPHTGSSLFAWALGVMVGWGLLDPCSIGCFSNFRCRCSLPWQLRDARQVNTDQAAEITSLLEQVCMVQLNSQPLRDSARTHRAREGVLGQC